MSSANQTVPFPTKVVLSTGTFLTLLGVALFIVAVWGLGETHQEYSALLLERAPFLVQNTGISAFYAGFPFLGSLLVFGLFMIAAGIRRRRFSQVVNKRVFRLAYILLFVGLLGLFAGRPIANNIWAQTFEDAGYTECAAGFSITKRWFTAVWTLAPDLCSEGEVRRMFSSHEYGLPDINAYVKARNESGNS